LRNCPRNLAGGSRPQGSTAQQQYPVQPWVYSLTPRGGEEEEAYAGVVTGTIPLFGNLACTLFDSGAMHSFISSTYVQICSMIIQPLKQSISVATPVGDVVTCREFIEDCPLIIEGRVLTTNLAVFQMLGFDIILGMDLLSKFYASIDCRKKEFVFRPPNDVEFKFGGS